MRRRGLASFVAGVALAAAVFPVTASAFEAKGTVNSTGLGYDNVYGVFNGHALMGKGDKLDLVISSGEVVHSTTKGLGTYLDEGAKDWLGKGFVRTKATGDNKGTRYGVITADGKEVLPAIYNDVCLLKDGSYILAAAYDRGVSCVVNLFSSSGVLLDSLDCGLPSSEADSGFCTFMNVGDDSAFLQAGRVSVSGGLYWKITVAGSKLVKSTDSSSASSSLVDEFVSPSGDNCRLSYDRISGQLILESNAGKVVIPYDDHTGSYSRMGGVIRVTGEPSYDEQGHYRTSYSDYWCNGTKTDVFANYGSLAALANGKRYLGLNQDTNELSLLDSEGTCLGIVQSGVSWLGGATLQSGKPASCSWAKITKSDGDHVVDFNGKSVLSVESSFDCWSGPDGNGAYLYCLKQGGSTGDRHCSVYSTDDFRLVAGMDHFGTFQSIGDNMFIQQPGSYISYGSDGMGHENCSGYSGPGFVAKVYNISNGFAPVTVSNYTVAAYRDGKYAVDNSPYFSAADAWWAVDGEGKWGLVKLDGTVVAPFEYEGYMAEGDGSLALVKKNGNWYFFDTSDGQRAIVPNGGSRVSGSTRYDTMSKLVAQGGWEEGSPVVLACGDNFPDALSASSLAGDLEGPIVLTDSSYLSDEARDVLSKVKPKQIFIVGGIVAVSEAVADAASQAAGNCRVTRIAGDTRYNTSLEVMKLLGEFSSDAIVATGSNYADALSISPYAYATASPVVLCDPDSGLSDTAIEELVGKGCSRVIIVGGEKAVPKSAEEKLNSAGIKTVRLSGETRYETSQKIAEFELSSNSGITASGFLLATGSNFPDALAAGPVADKALNALLLVDPGAEESVKFLSGFKGDVKGALVVGGSSAVADHDASSLYTSLGLI